MRKVLSLLTALVLCYSIAWAQTKVVTGKIAYENGEPAPFVSINIKGANTGTTADADGRFSIRAKKGDVLVVSAIGVARQEATVDDGNIVSITVKRSEGILSEIVVTALGVQRQAKELGYSTAKVKSAELTQAKVVNLQNGLTGKVSGLNVQTVNNGVFADTRITLRGIRSLTGNNQPMLIVDGVPISLSYLSTINPNDVADVTILKSSSATAIYGPDGVNGALVVTTRRGSKAKPLISFSHTTQVEQVSFMPKFQDKFGSGSSVNPYGYGVYDPIENQGYGDAFDGSLRQIGRDAPDGSKNMITYEPRLDEKKKFWNTGITNQTEVSYATGDFYLSAQNVDIKGVTPKDENHRRSVRMSANKEYGKFKANFNLTYTNGNYDIHAGDRFGNGRDYMVYWLLINTPAQIPITKFKNWQKDYWSSPDGYFSDYYSNPWWALDNFRAVGRTNDFLGNIELNLKATSWLNFTYRLGGTVSSAYDKGTQGALTYSDFAKESGKSIAGSGDLKAAVHQTTSTSSRLNSEFFATVRKDFNKFRVDGLVGYSFRETKTNFTGVSSSNLGIANVFNVSVREGEATPSMGESKARLQRFFAKASVGFDNWVFAEVTGSYDIDSRLGDPYNFKMDEISYFYPGASLSTVLSEAIPALKESKVLSYLKVRGAISKTGNVNLGVYNTENTYSPGGGFPYGTLIGFTSDNTLVRPDYRPEFVVNKEVGIELGFLNNRINFEATAYTQDNTDQIITVAYSGATGYSNALLNAASFTNKGLEFDLRLTPLVKIGQGSIDLKINYTYQTNKVNSLLPGVDELGIGNGNYIIKGMPAYTFKLTDYVKDSLGRVVVDRNTGLPTVDPVIKTFGQTIPKHILGFNLNANWKGFNLGVVLDYRGGNQIYSGNLGNNMDFTGLSLRSGQNGRQPFVFPNSVYDDGTGKYVPNNNVYTTGGYNFYSVAVNTSAMSNYISSGSFWKLREVSIGYQLPAGLFTGTPIKGATFTLTGRNLFTWIPSTNQWTDPEFSNTTGNAIGVSGLGNTPPTRLFGANLTVNF
jgi:TonB-linked SusC/RagA family outer membrane protein